MLVSWVPIRWILDHIKGFVFHIFLYFLFPFTNPQIYPLNASHNYDTSNTCSVGSKRLGSCGCACKGLLYTVAAMLAKRRRLGIA